FPMVKVFLVCVPMRRQSDRSSWIVELQDAVFYHKSLKASVNIRFVFKYLTEWLNTNSYHILPDVFLQNWNFLPSPHLLTSLGNSVFKITYFKGGKKKKANFQYLRFSREFSKKIFQCFDAQVVLLM
uniref:Uncharacterized protein n=1 Tax=Coturnix japonica TaxID=93934 RepID=A0A8C2TQP8_COTJA